MATDVPVEGLGLGPVGVGLVTALPLTQVGLRQVGDNVLLALVKTARANARLLVRTL